MKELGMRLQTRKIMLKKGTTLCKDELNLVFRTKASYFLYLGYKAGYSSYISPVFSQSPIFIGVIYSLSYILGELVNSFIKRQMNISAGRITHTKFKSLQTFFDLTDGIIVVVFALLVFTSASVNQVLTAGIIGIFLHYCTDLFMKRLRLKH